MSSSGVQTIIGNLPKQKKFTVVSLFDSGVIDFDNNVKTYKNVIKSYSQPLHQKWSPRVFLYEQTQNDGIWTDQNIF